MSEKAFENALATLIRIKKKHPHLRLGQILSNATPEGTDLFYLEDFQLALALTAHEYLTTKEEL